MLFKPLQTPSTNVPLGAAIFHRVNKHDLRRFGLRADATGLLSSADKQFVERTACTSMRLPPSIDRNHLCSNISHDVISYFME